MAAVSDYQIGQLVVDVFTACVVGPVLDAYDKFLDQPGRRCEEHFVRKLTDARQNPRGRHLKVLLEAHDMVVHGTKDEGACTRHGSDLGQQVRPSVLD